MFCLFLIYWAGRVMYACNPGVEELGQEDHKVTKGQHGRTLPQENKQKKRKLDYRPVVSKVQRC